MGFRNLRAFNLAMLAKQGWRILQKPNLLLSQILKSRYFPKCDFLQAKNGYNPSFTWRSIWEGRSTLEAGLRWKIGNGKNVLVWGDKWIPRPSTFKTISPMIGGFADLRVADLIDPINRSWKGEVIDNLLWPEDAIIIKDIPLGRNSSPDIQVWHYTKSGTFSVKSAYHVTTSLLSQYNSSKSGQSSSWSRAWAGIWSARVPNKIKVFLWRACKEAIPTTANLIRRKCVVDENCTSCGAPLENSKHVFLDCSFARQTWALADIPNSVISQWEQDMEGWIVKVRDELDHEKFNFFLVLCWKLWNRRNKLVMENRTTSPLDTVLLARSFLHDFMNCIVISNKPGQTITKEVGSSPGRLY
ncbi:UNVERIFIED_CONTAM: hypothetical protein Sradi_5656900 [Sesamum radiatum]|uniref:Reverse transcriptase zinc-binding domain-containing protein n=1 Tax=Sesamum radiatum TaxID=300843 RepID=A0AAW2L2T9_SESRA